MENEILKINILSIAVSGLLMLIAGVCLYYFKTQLSGGGIRFFLPIPPIGVAAYIFAFNMFKHYDGHLPAKSTMISEILFSTLASALFFFIFTVLLIYIIERLRAI